MEGGHPNNRRVIDEMFGIPGVRLDLTLLPLFISLSESISNFQRGGGEVHDAPTRNNTMPPLDHALTRPRKDTCTTRIPLHHHFSQCPFPQGLPVTEEPLPQQCWPLSARWGSGVFIKPGTGEQWAPRGLDWKLVISKILPVTDQ